MRNKSFQLKSEKCFGGKHITNWGKFLQIGGSFIITNWVSAVTNWGSNYKLAQQLLQNRAAITSWNKCITK